MSTPDHTPSAWIARVRSSLDTGQVANATALLRQWAASAPALAEPWAMLGAVLLQTGDIDGAEMALRTSLQRNPQNADALTHLATILMSKGETATALSHLKLAHQTNPQHLGAWLVLARSRLTLGDAGGAERCLRAAEAIQPDLPAQALFQLAGVLQERMAFAEATPYYERAIAKDPVSFLYRGNFADMLCGIGEVEAGLTQHRAILTREPNRLRSHLALELTLTGVPADVQTLGIPRAIRGRYRDAARPAG